MKSLFKAELRKLLTIRSTYIMVIIGTLLIVILSFWVNGYKGIGGSASSQLTSGAIDEIVMQATGVGVLFCMIIAILFTAHEYRYNTIIYTLTSESKRSKVLISKVLTITAFSIVLGLFFAILGYLTYKLGILLRGADLPAQNISLSTALLKISFFYMGYALFATFSSFIARSVVASVSIMFMIPAMVEPLLSPVLSENSKYLPFVALNSTISSSSSPNTLASGDAIVVTGFYILIMFFVTLALFIRRDAN